MAEKLQYIDLFAGCGGLSLGLHEAGFQGLFAVEKNPDAFLTLKHNLIDKNGHFKWPSWLEQSSWHIDQFIKTYEKQLLELRGKIDLIVGGPPCQGFSMAGQRQEGDERNQLIHSYLKVVELVQPKMLVFENVSGFTFKFKQSEKNGQLAYSEIVVKKLHELGYTDALGKTIDMSKYGVPQRRKRFIMIASRTEIAEEVFQQLNKNKQAFLEEKELEEKPSVQDAISDLEYKHGTKDSSDTKGFQAGITSRSKSSLQSHLRLSKTNNYTPDSHRFVNHREKTKEIFYKMLAEAPRDRGIVGEERAAYGIKKRNVVVLDPKLPSRTITSIPDDFIHYAEPRVMTVRECARIQTFPDWFEFKGKYTSGGKRRVQEVPRYTQVGNAVPPLFAEQLGLAIKEVFTNG